MKRRGGEDCLEGQSQRERPPRSRPYLFVARPLKGKVEPLESVAQTASGYRAIEG